MADESQVGTENDSAGKTALRPVATLRRSTTEQAIYAAPELERASDDSSGMTRTRQSGEHT